MTPKEQFIAWLNDAYSTEIALIPVLLNHAKDAREYPEIYERDMRHAEETRRQADDLKNLIERLGGKVSTAKTVLGKMLGAGQSISTEFFQDEITKNFLADYAAEHFEIASYKALIATAEQIGEHEAIPVLESILREEEEMARWIEEHLPMAVRIGLEKTTTQGARKQNRSTAAGLFSGFNSPASLNTLVIGGAVGASLYYIFKSMPRKNNHKRSRIHGGREHQQRLSAPITGTATDESGSPTARVPVSDNLRM